MTDKEFTIEDKDTCGPTLDRSLIPKIDLHPHTVFLLCGPTGSGKTQFSENLMTLAETRDLKFAYISSDAIRRDLLSASSLSPTAAFNRADMQYSDGMEMVSNQAFQILMQNLELYTAYPISSEVVIVDTTGMNKVFRNQVKAIADKNHYRLVLVTFEYKSRADYMYEGISEKASYIVDKAVQRFRKNVLPEVGSKDFPNRLRIKNVDSFGWENKGADIDLWMENAVSSTAESAIELLESCRQLDYMMKYDDAPTFAVIGDSHECVAELTQLVTIIESRFPQARIVHVSDYLDKGLNTAEMVEYMYGRIGKGDIFLKANHENYLAGRLRGEISAQPEVERQYFTALPVLQGNKELADKFLTIFDCSKPFAILGDYDTDGGVPVIVTHAPCSAKYLGKVTSYAMREQRNYRTQDKSKSWLEELKWFYEEADKAHPLHIFGHVAHKVTDEKGYRFKNKIFLDTGCVYGGKLSAVVVKQGRVQTFLSVPSTKEYVEGMPENLGFGPPNLKPFSIDDYDLDPRDLRLLNHVVTNEIKYISGTMAPAPSSETEIEPLDEAFARFKRDGVTQVILEPKYMGSRCQMYLFSAGPKLTFATSRSGWKIRGVSWKTDEEYKAFLASVWEEHKELIQVSGNLILDGELLPWHALGKELIDRSFEPYAALIENELNSLSSDRGFKALTEFSDKYDLEGKKTHLSSFKEVLGRFSASGEPQFKAFDILKADRLTDLANMQAWFKWDGVNSDQVLVVNLDQEEEVQGAHKFFNTLTVELGMEGVVVKPNLPKPGDIPYMKVRSKEYLRLVYGYDYLNPTRYARLVRQKNISGKLRLSIQEHNLATDMLRSEGNQMKELIVKMIGSMKQEASLDPRL